MRCGRGVPVVDCLQESLGRTPSTAQISSGTRLQPSTGSWEEDQKVKSMSTCTEQSRPDENALHLASKSESFLKDENQLVLPSLPSAQAEQLCWECEILFLLKAIRTLQRLWMKEKFNPVPLINVSKRGQVKMRTIQQLTAPALPNSSHFHGFNSERNYTY